MTPRPFILGAALLCVTGALRAQTPATLPVAPASTTPPSAAAVVNPDAKTTGVPVTVSAARISDHVNFLASELLDGRAAGTRGADIAAAYIATAFALAGLRPAGDHGSFLQPVPLESIVTQPVGSVALQPDGGTAIPLKLDDDVLVTDESGAPQDTVNAPIVFVGFGLADPALGRDDYAGVDVSGKVVLMFAGLPDGAEATLLRKGTRDDGTPRDKFATAAAHGAVGAIIVAPDAPDAATAWSRLSARRHGPWLRLRDDKRRYLQAAMWIHHDVARVLFAAAHLPLEKALAEAASTPFAPVVLPLSLQAQMASDVRPVDADNVLAWLPGTEPGTPRQVVLYSAHYDGLGRDGTTVFPGAVDNATGVGMLIELATAAAGNRPRHALLLAATTAGAAGDLGMRYLAAHLPVDDHDIAAAMNFESVPPLGIPEEIVATNSARARALPLLRSVAQQSHLRLIDNDDVTAVGSGWTESLPLATRGIPAFALNEGVKFAGHSREWGAAKLQEYRLQRAQQPTDRYRPEMNFTGNARVVQYGLALGRAIGDLDAPLRWRGDDAFGPRNARAAASDAAQP